jgi:hypothetical protein
MTTMETIFCFRELFRILEVFFLDGAGIGLSFVKHPGYTSITDLQVNFICCLLT